MVTMSQELSLTQIPQAVPWALTPDNRDTAARFVKSGVEAVAFMKQNRAAFDASLAKWFNITDGITQERMFAVVMDFPVWPQVMDATLYLNWKRWSVRWIKEMGIRKAITVSVR